jgi:hypothetical protein
MKRFWIQVAGENAHNLLDLAIRSLDLSARAASACFDEVLTKVRADRDFFFIERTYCYRRAADQIRREAQLREAAAILRGE